MALNEGGFALRVSAMELCEFNSVFGWIDFRRGGKYRRENGVEK